MTICFFSAQYLPTSGGVERYTDHLARYAAAQGHRVLVATSALPGLPARETTADGVEIFRLPAKLCMQGRFPVPVPGGAFRALARALWDEAPDLVVIQTRFYLLSLYAAREAKRRGVPMLLIEHGTGHLVPDGRLARFVGHVYEHMAARYLRRKCRHFYGVSNGVCEWLRHFHITADGVLYNAVDVREIDAILRAAPPVDWRAELSLPESAKLVLFAGRLIPEKGVRELVDAAHRLHTPGAVLLLAGDGPLLGELKEAHSADAAVRLLGQLPYETLLGLYAQADVLCLPSYSEGFPTALLEAAACGCAEIASDTGGVREILPAADYGTVLPSVDPETIAGAIDRALHDDAGRAASGALLRRRVEENFDWPVTARRFLAVAESLARPSGAGNEGESA